MTTTKRALERLHYQRDAGATRAEPSADTPLSDDAIATPLATMDTMEVADDPSIDFPGMDIAPEPKTEVTMRMSGDRVFISGTDNDDVIRVRQRGDIVFVRAGKETFSFDRSEVKHIEIEALKGNDRIKVGRNVDIQTTLRGGEGRDVIRGGGADDVIYGDDGRDKLRGGDGWDIIEGGSGNDKIVGGRGRDIIEGGRGDDRLRGGADGDVIYGLDGADTIAGGAGQDYLDGGVGDDKMHGGSGNDAVMGGRGNDTLAGGAHGDTLAGGDGVDTFRGGAGTNRIYHEEGETIAGKGALEHHEVVDMAGTPGSKYVRLMDIGGEQFRARAESDLDALRSIPTGRDLLSAIDDNGHEVLVRPMSHVVLPLGDCEADHYNGNGAGSKVGHDINNIGARNQRDQHEAWEVDNPLVGIAHELIHAENSGRGRSFHHTARTNGVRNSELQTIGQPVDHDNNPDTPPKEVGRFTEDMVREELSMPSRPRYFRLREHDDAVRDLDEQQENFEFPVPQTCEEEANRKAKKSTPGD